ncbi:hypothetical protein PPERSA_09939 [Pseudocohnilembus persalinus]|uniref:GOLD domain-containing protein n=1 Tax=Pseudocohnilembus persalinus TaxID=266149 RepID=A0A0V0QJA6_PSEPJ|nr:hypothetical protein PPERSA_09939 [Pseudocohnilembus persalinus]|eukprot:KRX02322.1 hypothetical protein PPERSA_09939 [Pseudocohnilembus persalinus]
MALQSNALHFYLQEGREKCLMDDVPEGVLIQGYWHFMEPIPGVELDSTQEGVKITVYGPNGKQLNTYNTFYNSPQNRGKFSLATQTYGQYKFCLKTTTSHLFSSNKRIKYGLKLVIGEPEEVDAAKGKDITGLNKQIKDISKTSKEFIKYQEMQREQEDKLSESNLKVNDRVVYATVHSKYTL